MAGSMLELILQPELNCWESIIRELERWVDAQHTI